MYCATIGFFDGVHLGHQFILRQLWSIATEEGLRSAIITFNEHPAKILHGQDMPLLTTQRERMDMLRSFGADQIFAFRFEAVRDMTAEEFMGILHTQCGVDLLLMGYDQHFGSDGLRHFADYEMAAMRVGMRVRLLPEAPDYTANEGGLSFLTATGQPVPPPSSSVIRKCLQEGDVSTANFLLGRPYAMNGLVIEGKQIGRQIGFPTANIELQPGKLIPAPGVYVCEVSFPQSRLKAPFEKKRALLNIGTNPTVSGEAENPLSIEVYIPDFDGNLYNRRMTVCPLRFIRAERKFVSLEELKQQITEDLKQL